MMNKSYHRKGRREYLGGLFDLKQDLSENYSPDGGVTGSLVAPSGAPLGSP